MQKTPKTNANKTQKQKNAILQTFIPSAAYASDNSVGFSPFGRKDPSRDEDGWRPFFANIDRMYRTKECILPKGTILYHGSLLRNSLYPGADGLVFFGLDCEISTWILTESAAAEAKKNSAPMKQYGFLHVFVLTQPLKYEYVDEDQCHVTDEPNNIRCTTHPCVHAQIIFRGIPDLDNPFIDLGTELSMPSDIATRVTRHVGVHKVSIQELFAHIFEHNYSSWKPQSAIVQTFMD